MESDGGRFRPPHRNARKLFGADPAPPFNN
jgi:hypothetical protein